MNNLPPVESPPYEGSIPSERNELMSLSETVSTSATNATSAISGDDHCEESSQIDVLPSFHMHQSVVNRSAYVKEDAFDFVSSAPPLYTCQRGATCVPANDLIDDTRDNTRDASILENVDRLKKVNSPLEIKLHLTKKRCQLNRRDVEHETPLKEYTSGDFVFGYYTVKNTSTSPLKFEQVLVTLEGQTAVYNAKTQQVDYTNFMRMCDLSAGYIFGNLPMVGAEGYSCGISDVFGDVLYLPGNQLLMPGVTYKKFFTFKMPVQLLDEACSSVQQSHLMLPPTFGIDKSLRSEIVYNSTLGYGRTNRPGDPLMMQDYSHPDVAIDYSVKVRVIGANPVKDDDFKVAIVSERSNSLRFIPFGFCIPFEIELSTNKQLDLLYKRIERELAEAKQREELSLSINESIPASAFTDEELLEMKTEQLAINNDPIPAFPLPNSTKELIIQKSSLQVKPKRLFLAGKALASSVMSNGNSLGTIDMETTRPTDGIPYIIPKPIQNMNLQSKMSSTSKANWSLLKSTLTSVEKKNLQELKMELTFTPACSTVKPPPVESITAQLEVNNIWSKNPIPFTIDQDFLTDKNNVVAVKKKFGELADQFKQLKPDAKILRKTLEDLNSMSNLKMEQRVVPLFKLTKKVVSNWSPHQDAASGRLVWKTEVHLQLEVNDMRTLTLIPTFQSCCISRFYNIQVGVKIGGNTSSLNIPVRVRKFLSSEAPSQ